MAKDEKKGRLILCDAKPVLQSTLTSLQKDIFSRRDAEAQRNSGEKSVFIRVYQSLSVFISGSKGFLQ